MEVMLGVQLMRLKAVEGERHSRTKGVNRRKFSNMKLCVHPSVFISVQLVQVFSLLPPKSISKETSVHPTHF
jgi:hypothetical protein